MNSYTKLRAPDMQFDFTCIESKLHEIVAKFQNITIIYFFFPLYTAQKILWIWSHLPKKPLMENFIFLYSDSPILVKKTETATRGGL